MIILGIDTSCDDTSVGIVQDGARILSNAVASQAGIHARFGGVVPEIASRSHLSMLLPLMEKSLAEAGVNMEEVDAVAATVGPGLIGSLLVGLSAAKALAWIKEKPFVGVDHIHAHVYAAKMADENLPYPHISLVASGGHTMLFNVKSPLEMELIGRTLDDAAGEAMDKASALLGLGYPGGPAIEAKAKETDEELHPPLPVPLKKTGSLDFSFSGLKAALARRTREKKLTQEQKALLAKGFQKSVVEHLVTQVMKAIATFKVRALAIGGGVASNQYLRKVLSARAGGVYLSFPPAGLCTDNAAMVAGLAFEFASRNIFHPLRVPPYPRFRN